jgi:hypothetical protein
VSLAKGTIHAKSPWTLALPYYLLLFGVAESDWGSRFDTVEVRSSSPSRLFKDFESIQGQNTLGTFERVSSRIGSI